MRCDCETSLRYGENPHQAAALYALPNATPGSLVRAEKLHGKELSYNNLLDLDSALAVARSLPAPGVAVLKHNNPCGAATAATLGEAMRRAWDGDPVSAFGSVLGFNVPVDAASGRVSRRAGSVCRSDRRARFHARGVRDSHHEAEVESERAAARSRRRSSRAAASSSCGRSAAACSARRPTTCPTTNRVEGRHRRAADRRAARRSAIRLGRVPAREIERDRAGEGAGAGGRRRRPDEPRRFGGDRHPQSGRARTRRGARLRRVLSVRRFDPPRRRRPASRPIIQPGGSRRDDEVIAACNEHGLPMIFTGRRHFRH